MRLGLTTAMLLGLAATPPPLAGQEAPSMRFHITADAGVSLQDGPSGVRFGRDMVSYGLRLTMARGQLHPWLDGARFDRPDLHCVSGLACNDSGWLARAGIAAPLAGDRDTAGPTAEARAGVGAGFADETAPSYLLGLTLLWRGIPWVVPGVEFRWEHIAGINFTMLAAGIRIGL